jgi:RNA polymerase sigma-70 factor, ECF subfamily
MVNMQQGFDELYAGHFTSVATQLYAYFGDREEARDVTQEAFCRALARWRDVSTYDDPVAWVRRVAWNLASSSVLRPCMGSASCAAAFHMTQPPRIRRSPGR